MWNAWGKTEMYTQCWWGKLKERGNLKDTDGDASILLKCILKKQNRRGHVSSDTGREQVAGCCETV